VTAFFDTNPLLYPFDSASPEKPSKARDALSRQGQRDEVLPSMQVLEGIRIVNPFLAAPA
jgi:predicted nucleic acid-binding protein